MLDDLSRLNWANPHQKLTIPLGYNRKSELSRKHEN